MLHRESVNKELLDLLERLMNIEAFDKMILVGGTALALQIGNRASVDIVLFGNYTLNERETFEALIPFQKVEKIGGSQSIHMFFINGIKVDLVNYPYPWLLPPVVEDNIRLASIQDIAAMKIAAITQRGSKKDFIDLYFLLERFTLKEILQLYKQKISDANEWLAIRSAMYFEDADNQPQPQIFSNLDWKEIKNKIRQEVMQLIQSK